MKPTLRKISITLIAIIIVAPLGWLAYGKYLQFRMWRLIYNDNSAEVVALLRKNPRLIGSVNYYGAPILNIAVNRGHVDLVKYLLSCGVDTQVDVQSVGRPFQNACYHGKYEMVRSFIEYGEDVNYQPRTSLVYGGAPLHLAAFKGNYDVAELLILSGADVNAKDKLTGGYTPLHHAASSMYVADRQGTVLKVLIKYGADPTVVNDIGETPYELCGRLKNLDPELCELLSY